MLIRGSKWLCLVAAMMMLVIASGGCGGSSSSGNGNAGTLSINCTWRITSGTLTYYSEDGTIIDVNYISGSSEPERFTLTLSEADSEDYIINVSNTGIFYKEGSPYVKADFDGIQNHVRVIWGTSEHWQDFKTQGWIASTYELIEANTYYAEFPITIHDVNSATFQILDSSTIKYTRKGLSMEGTNAEDRVDVTLNLTRPTSSNNNGNSDTGNNATQYDAAVLEGR